MEEYLDPLPEERNRRLAFVVTVAFLATGLIGGALLLTAHVKRIPTCEGVAWLITALYAFDGLMLVPILWMVHKAWLGLQYRQIPAPGSLIFKRTKVVRGRSAQIRAGLSMVAALLAILLLTYSLDKVDRLREFFPACST